MTKRIEDEGRDFDSRSSLVSSAITFIDDGSDNEYAESVEKGHGMDWRARKIFVMGVTLVAIYAIGLFLPRGIIMEVINDGTTAGGYTLAMFVDDISTNFNYLLLEFSGIDIPWAKTSSVAIEFVVIIIAGAGLALCGAVYQGAFRNPLVSPSTLGVMSGGSLGLAIWVWLCVTDDGDIIVPFLDIASKSLDSGEVDALAELWRDYSMVFISFAGCLIVVSLVLLVMRFARRNSNSPLLIIITGQIIASIAGAVTSSIRYYYVALNPYSLKSELFTNLEVASFWRKYSWVDIFALVIPLLLVFFVVMHYRQKMMILSFDDVEQRTMGINTRKMQVIVVGLCTFLTAAIISFCGRIGFVGFLVPHLARRLVGPNFKYLLPATCVLGGLFVFGSYLLLITVLGTDFDDIVGVVISILGGFVFLVTAIQGKGTRRGQFS